MLNQETKDRVRSTVQTYIMMFPYEYEAFKTQMVETRKNQANKFSELVGSETVHRALAEYPETLDTMLLHDLTSDEYKELKTIKGFRWFCRAFPVFQLAEIL